MAAQLTTELPNAGELQKEYLLRKPLLKRMDEYDYMKYTVPAMKLKRIAKRRSSVQKRAVSELMAAK